MPYCAQGCFSDDQVFIVVQPDQRFFRADCTVMADLREEQAASSSSAQPPAAPEEGPGQEPLMDILQRPHRPVRGGPGELAGGEFAKPTPELLDLLRLRKQAKAWTEHNPNGQAEFIWWCHNSSKCLINPEGCCEHHCTAEEYKTIRRHKGIEWRDSAFSAGDIGVMFTARWARMFMTALASVLLPQMFVPIRLPQLTFSQLSLTPFLLCLH